MGWLYDDERLRRETPVQFLMRELSRANGPWHTKVLDASVVHGTVYAAVRHTGTDTGQSYVLCAVIPFKNTKEAGFGYKAMNETMGPVEVGCPDRIMRLLSPIQDICNPGDAADWRARVAAAKSQREAAARHRGPSNPAVSRQQPSGAAQLSLDVG